MTKSNYLKHRIVIEDDIRWRGVFNRVFSSRLTRKWNELMDCLRTHSYYRVEVDTLIHDLNKIKAFFKKYAKKDFAKLMIRPVQHYGDYMDEDRSYNFEVMVGRFETKEEFKLRMQKREKRLKEENERKVAQEKRKLEELQSKYGE